MSLDSRSNTQFRIALARWYGINGTMKYYVEGLRFRAFVSEKKPDGKLLARTSNYRPVIVDAHYGEFVDVELIRGATHCFVGRIL